MERSAALLVTAASFLAASVLAQVTVDPALPDYEATSGVSGNLSSIGSDTLNNLMTLWAEGFRGFYPNVATEEALSAVPRSMREGSLACGASKWQAIWNVVLPKALPGIVYLGRLIEYDATDKIFTNPAKQQTEDYVSGRFG